MQMDSPVQTKKTPTGLCRDCLTQLYRPANKPPLRRCPTCSKPRLLTHPELFDLSIAHLDCDAFYASVEKRDNPDLNDKPLIIGGGKRGVVSTCCYIARTYGVRSAMPAFTAKALCPDAIFMPPNMSKYTSVGKEIRERMRALTPMVEPLSIDEAFMDLSGTQRLHHAPPVLVLAKLAKEIEQDIGISVSIGLSHNKFLAKIASDFDKPRGFSVIGKAETESFLEDKPVGIIWGVGKAFQKKLAGDGITKIKHLWRVDEKTLAARYGQMGLRLFQLSRGKDTRTIKPHRPTKSISNEITFPEDVRDVEVLSKRLWRLCEKVSGRAKASEHAGKTIVLKLKTADFKSRTRSQTLPDPTQLADVIFKIADPLLRKEANGTPFRLLGVGISNLDNANYADPPDMLNPEAEKNADAERAMDVLRAKFGDTAIGKGRGLTAKSKPS